MSDLQYDELAPDVLGVSFLSHDDCTLLIERAEASGWSDAAVRVSTSGPSGVHRPATRSANVIYFQPGSEVWDLVSAMIRSVIGPVVKRQWRRHFEEHSIIQIVRYDEGDYYALHSDTMPAMQHRQFAIVGYLNDAFTGGETYFPGADFHSIPVRGRAIVFPADVPHEATPVLSGTKYAVVAWLVSHLPST